MNTNVSATTHLDLPSWRFKPSRLGCLDANPGEIEFKPLTLVCGQNNTGKTWVMYALYGFLTSPGVLRLPEMDKLAEELVREGQLSWNFVGWLQANDRRIGNSIHQAMKRRLPAVFNSAPDLFKDSRFDWEIDHAELSRVGLSRSMDFRLMLGREKNEMLRITKAAGDGTVHLALLTKQFPDVSFILSDAIARHLIGLPDRRSVFLMPAERSGLHLFYRELANRRTALLHHASKKDKDIDIVQLIQDVARSRYAEPIAHYIDWLNDLPDVRKRKAGVFHAMAEEVKKIAGGRYEVDAEGDITFTPRHCCPVKLMGKSL